VSEQFDPRLKQYMLQRTGLLPDEGALEPLVADEEVPVLVRLAGPSGEAVPGLRVVADFGPVVTGRVALGRVVELRRHPRVASLKISRLVSPPPRADPQESDVADDSAEGEVTERWPLFAPTGLDGSGLLVASCDWGLDIAHAAFRRDDGGTRLRALWDQRTPPGPSSPAPYGYGRVLTASDIDTALRADDPYMALGYDPADVDVDGQGTHATHVLDIAAGSGRAPGSRPGLACKSDLAFVHLAANDIGPGETLGDSVRIAEAIHWLAGLADGEPLVINVSAGATGGPHDRSPLLVQALDALISGRPGLAVVMSGGNYAISRLHACGGVPADGSVTLPWIVRQHGTRPAEFEVWYPGDERLTVTLLDPDGNEALTLGAGDDQAARGPEGTVASGFHRLHDPNNGDNVADLFLWPSAAPGTWRVRLSAPGRPVTRVHCYVERVDSAQSWLGDPQDGMTVEPSGTTGTICNGTRTLAVGALDTRTLPARPAIFSSFGPSRDGLPKPDLAAPGVGITAARSSPAQPGGKRPTDLLTRKSGSSMAAPIVTGSVALVFQAALPFRLSSDDLRRTLLGTARPVPGLPPDLAPRVGAGVPDPVLASATVRSLLEATMTMPAWPAYPPGPYWGESGPATAMPILLVPGIMGSRLVEPSDPARSVWDPTGPPEAPFAPGPLDLVRLTEVDRPLRTAPLPNNIPRLLLSAGEIARATQIGNIGSLIFMFYGRMALALSSAEFSQQVEQAVGLPPRVYGAGYDWRQSCRVAAATLEELVSTALAECRSRQVVLVAHSMGGIVSRWFCKNRAIDGRPGADYVAALCLLGSPTHGAPEAYRWLKFGIDPTRDFPWAALLAGPGGPSLASAMQAMPFFSRQYARCFTSVFELLPTQAYCRDNPAWVTADGAPAGGDAETLYGSTTLGFGAADSDAMRAQLAARRTLHDGGAQAIGGYMPDRSLVVAGTGVPTDGSYQVRTSGILGPSLQGIAMTSGDGTVPSYSAMATGLPLGTGTRAEAPGTPHRDLCNDPKVIKAVQDAVLQRVRVLV
jgi:subtilase family protein/lecithin:cholesterol acyltransferase